MKSISTLLRKVQVVTRAGAEEVQIDDLCYDSRQVTTGSCFFAVRGTAMDGHRFIPMAEERGAVAVVCQALPEEIHPEVAYIVVEDSERAMAEMAAAFYDYPSRELKLVGITGTNGKTTTATLLYELVRKLGYRAGLISTVVYRIDDREIPSTHTTPDAIRLNAMLREMVDAGCDYCFMEVSSHSLVQERVRGLKFRGAMFTNLTHDHLDYHGTFIEYVRAKKRLFDSLPKSAFALVNVDDRNGEVMVQNTRAKVSRYSLRQMADFRCKVLEMLFDGMLLRVNTHDVWVKFLGRFNAYNLLCVYGAAVLLGSDEQEVLQALSSLHSVSGRFEPVRSEGGVTAIVDYAHTPDALENVIATINDIRTPAQQLIVVCGCGGDRDATKRPEMGRIASREADIAIFTSDNPRTEDPAAIIEDILVGVRDKDTPYTVVENRVEAIHWVIDNARSGDTILLAGKGHETYQILKEETIHLDEREVVAEALAKED